MGERLRESSLRRLLDFVAEAEAAALSDRQTVRALVIEGLARVLPCDGVMLTQFDPPADRMVTTASDPRIFALRLREPEAWATCLGHHPTVVRFHQTRNGEPLRFSDLLSRRAYRQLPIYQDFFRPFGIEYKLDVRVWPGREHVDVGCWRQRHDFSEQDRTTLDALRPYLTAILRRADRAALADTVRDAFGLTSREGQLLACVARGQRNREIAHQLFLAEGTVRKHLEHIYAKLGVSTRNQAIASVVRVASSGDADEPVRKLPARLQAEDAARRYALTGREVEVLALAAAGDANAVIAEKLAARPETIKKHLTHAYAKLGVAGRGESAAKLLGLHLIPTP